MYWNTCNSDPKGASSLSAGHVAQLLHESHFAHATSTLTPLAKSYLTTYINVAKNNEIVSEYVEGLLTAAYSEECAHVTEAGLAKLDTVPKAVNSIHATNEQKQTSFY